MKTLLFTIVAAFTVCLASERAMAQAAGQHGVFKATITIPVARVVIGTDADAIVTKTLTSNDVINLALGRPLGTKIDAKHEVLAGDITFEDANGGTPLSKLV